jgi:hypothetical protein
LPCCLGGWSAERSAGIGEGGDVLPPGTLVEINSQKPTGLVFEEGVNTHHVPTLRVVSHDLVVDGDEGLIHAVSAFASGLEQA